MFLSIIEGQNEEKGEFPALDFLPRPELVLPWKLHQIRASLESKREFHPDSFKRQLDKQFTKGLRSGIFHFHAC